MKATPTRKSLSNSAENGRELESSWLQSLCESSLVLGLAECAQQMLAQVTSRIQTPKWGNRGFVLNTAVNEMAMDNVNTTKNKTVEHAS